MGFADMQWKVVPVDPDERRRAQVFMRLFRPHGGGSGNILLSSQLRKELHVGEAVELLLNGRAIAVRPADKGSQEPRKVSKSTGQFTASRVVVGLLRFEPGESVRLPATIEDGHAWAWLPDELVERMRGGAA